MNAFDAGIALEQAQEAAFSGNNDGAIIADADAHVAGEPLASLKPGNPLKLAFHAGIM
jgi:hypothetical protein